MSKISSKRYCTVCGKRMMVSKPILASAIYSPYTGELKNRYIIEFSCPDYTDSLWSILAFKPKHNFYWYDQDDVC